MNQKFTLAKSNKIYALVITILYMVNFLIFANKTSYAIGGLVGRVLFVLLFATLVAWIVWWLAGKKEKGGQVTFNIVLSLILIGLFVQFRHNFIQSNKLKKIEIHKAAFKNDLATLDDPKEREQRYNKFVKSVDDGFNDLARTSRGEEKKFYLIMSNFVRDTQLTAQKWIVAYNHITASRMLDYARLSDNKEFDYQKNIAKTYIKESIAYNKFFTDLIPNLKERLSVFGKNNKLSLITLKGARDKYLEQKPIFEPLLATHIKYGNNILKVLELLQQNKSKWSYKNDELQFSDDKILNQYNALVDKLDNNEAMINSLASKLVNTI